VLVDGMAAGLWERKRRGKRVELDVQLVRRDRESDRIGLEREAERIGAFLGLEPVLSIVSS
jgi:DNA glycosylase AlkZ-like